MATVFSNTGRAITTNRLRAGGTEPLWIGWGTGAGTAAAGDTTLFTEARSTTVNGGDVTRTSGTSSQQTTTTTNDTYRVVGTVTADAAKTITNAGLFDGDGNVVSPGPPSGDNIFMKGDFTGIGLATNDSIQFTINVQYT